MPGLKSKWDLECYQCRFKKLILTAESQWQARKEAEKLGWLIVMRIMICPDCRRKNVS